MREGKASQQRQSHISIVPDFMHDHSGESEIEPNFTWLHLTGNFCVSFIQMGVFSKTLQGKHKHFLKLCTRAESRFGCVVCMFSLCILLPLWVWATACLSVLSPAMEATCCSQPGSAPAPRHPWMRQSSMGDWWVDGLTAAPNISSHDDTTLCTVYNPAPTSRKSLFNSADFTS